MIVIANVFPKLQTVEALVNHSLKSFASEHPLTISMLKGPSQTLVKSAWENFCHIFSSLWEELIMKIFPYEYEKS